MDYFYFFTHITARKTKISKKINKRSGDITIFHKCTENHDHLLSCFWDMVCGGCNYYFSFWAIFCPFIPVAVQKMKMKKNGKEVSRYHHFTHVYQKLWLDNVWFLRYGARRTDGWMDWESDTTSNMIININR